MPSRSSTVRPPRDLVWRDQRVHLRTAIPGPKSAALRAREDAHIAPGLQGYAVMSGVAVDHASGSAVTDVDGNTYLDFIGGIGVGALGHGHPDVVRAIGEQAARVSVGSFTSAARVELVERVAAHAPAPGVHRLQLYTSGAEAVESALRLAKSYTGKHEVVSFWGGFHGKTLGAMSLLGAEGKGGVLVRSRPAAIPNTVRRLLSVPPRHAAPILRYRVRRARTKAAPGAVRGEHRGIHRRADARHCRERRPSRRFSPGGALSCRRARSPAHRR